MANKRELRIDGKVFASRKDACDYYGINASTLYRRLQGKYTWKEPFKVEVDEGFFKPVKAHDTDAGFDLYAAQDMEITADVQTVNFGVHIAFPKDYVGLVLPRSSLSQQGLFIFTGVIDSGYTGAIKACCMATQEPIKIYRGDKIAQIVFVKTINTDLVVGNVSSLITDRGENGFGSTGK